MPRKPEAKSCAASAGSFAERVIDWQRREGRQGLPWQGTRDAYRVWLSEIMLQQTQVSTVLGYYGRFLERFPDVASLAAAPLDDVLAAWSGLGYYSRARNLWRCAQVVLNDHGGRFPSHAQALAELPGIGPSTAAAIAAFCFGERAAILDGNVKRVLARWLGFEADLAQASAVRDLWAQAETLLPGPQQADWQMPIYTQGLMDLGATVCSAREPSCRMCPIHMDCRAYQSGEPTRWPVKSRRLKRHERHAAWLWLEHQGSVWLQRRPEQGVWAGLLSLPELADLPAAREWLGPMAESAQALAPIRHVLTHFDWHLQPLRCHLSELPLDLTKQLARDFGDGGWFAYSDALQLGLPTPLRRLFASAVAGSA